MKKMKSYWSVLLAIMFVFAGCNKNSEEVDVRDPFVGTYAYAAEGEITLSIVIPGLDPKIPLNTEGIFQIEKLSKKDSVLISGAFDGYVEPIKAVVKGSQLELVENRYNVKGENFEALLTVDNTAASMVKDTLTWKADQVICTGKVFGIDVNGNGHVAITAQKKSVK